MGTLLEKITTSLAQFSSASRLYSLNLSGDLNGPGSEGLLVEAFAAEDEIQCIGARDVIAVSTSAHIDLNGLLGQAASLELSLADGTRSSFGGNISEVAMLGSEGGLARYRLRLSPWLWRLGQVRNSRVWQDKSIMEIVDSVLEAYSPLASWRWSDEVMPFLGEAHTRSYCCQYRESDLHFVERLLTEEGLAWRFEHTAEGVTAVLFADSTQVSAVPEDASSKLSGGIRFHNARAGERQDTVQYLRASRSMSASMTSLLSYDYKAKQSIIASSPSKLSNGAETPPLESFDVPGQYAYANADQAQRYADLQMQGREARSQLWHGRSTVRTLLAGTRLTILDSPLESLGATPAFSIVRVSSVGVNNLPSPAQQALAELFGPLPELLQECTGRTNPDDFLSVIEQARKSGYANCFEAVRAEICWRPQLRDGEERNHPNATAFGSQSAIVVGADGNDTSNGADEIYCDRLGRVRIRFHWQDNAAGCWVRVAQRSAGGGMGSQFLPRIGTEVLVQFLENDIDRPIIIGALYNGRGEGGAVPTPGGQGSTGQDDACFQAAHDHAGSGQANLAGGHGPVWHGASADAAGHRHNSSQWGTRSKEHGGSGYNQLLFDDTDAQGRVQLKCSHAGTELNLGHLIHASDNYRGSFRGLGAELRSDAYGSIRAGAGMLVSSYRLSHGASQRDPAGDNVAGIALLKQAVKIAEVFDTAATTHQTVALAAHAGARRQGQSMLDDQAAPLPGLLKALSGLVASQSMDAARSDARSKNTKAGSEKLPQTTDPIIGIAAKAGLGVHAAHSLQVANGEGVTLMSGQDTQFVAGNQMRVQSKQAIGILGGVVKAGENNTGLQMIAARDAINLQAQSDTLAVVARDQVSIMSANAHIDWAAAKRISLSTAGGANITIDGGNITIQCPGKIAILAGKKSFSGPGHLNYPLPRPPRSELEKRPLNFKMRLADTPGPNGHALANLPWIIAFGRRPDGMAEVDDKSMVAKGRTDDDGFIALSDAEQEKLGEVYAANPDTTWLVYPGSTVQLNVETEKSDWDKKAKLLQALNAADFSPELHASRLSEGAPAQVRYAQEAFGLSNSNDIFDKVRK